MRLSFFIFIFLYLNTAFADQLIIEPDMGRAPVLQFINQTQHALNVVMYDFTDKQLLNALLAKQHSRIPVQVILEKAPYKNEGLNINTMNVMSDQKLAWRPGARYYQYTHQKTLISDNQRAMIMTFNFTLSSFKNQRNFALVIDDPSISQNINAVFTADWNQRAGTPPVNHRLLFSPSTSRTGYEQALQAAHHSINLYEQSIADDGMVTALCNAAKRGVKIKIITSKMPPKKFSDALMNAGAVIKISKKLYIHAKAMALDNNTVILGSVNFTPTSLDKNRELAIISTDPTVAHDLTNTFYHDWDQLSAPPSYPHKKTSSRTASNSAPYQKLAYHFIRALLH